MYNGKYLKLYNYLFQKGKDNSHHTMTFSEIEEVLQFKLPNSSYKYPAWWANESEGNHTHALSWINAGWKTNNVKLGKSVTFIKPQP
jgi:hypothetical protein